MHYFDVSLENFESVPRECKITEFERILIIPRKGVIHDSGYLCMAFVGVINDEAICLRGGGSDVLHIDGLSEADQYFYPTTHRKAWSIDCTPNGLLCIFAPGSKLRFDDIMLSDASIYAKPLKAFN